VCSWKEPLAASSAPVWYGSAHSSWYGRMPDFGDCSRLTSLLWLEILGPRLSPVAPEEFSLVGSTMDEGVAASIAAAVWSPIPGST
jgi:hypothetical protein